MQQLLRSFDVIGCLLLMIVWLSLWKSKSAAENDKGTFRLWAKVCGGFLMVLMGLSWVLPDLASPRVTSRGIVSGFHQVHDLRNSHFEFRIGSKEPTLIAGYFDKGFYFDDPSVSDGDTVEVTYLNWTNEAVGIREIAGRHPGWTFYENPNPIGPWVVGAGGILLILTAIFGRVTDRLAKADDSTRADFSDRGLG